MTENKMIEEEKELNESTIVGVRLKPVEYSAAQSMLIYFNLPTFSELLRQLLHSVALQMRLMSISQVSEIEKSNKP